MDVHTLHHLAEMTIHVKVMFGSIAFAAVTAGSLFVLLAVESYLRTSQKEWHFGRTKKRLAK